MTSAASCSAASAELELLLCCARYGVRPRLAYAARAGELLRSGPDWKRLLGLAESHGIAPLLPGLLERYPELVPAAALERLRGYYRHNRLQNILLAGELCSVLDRLEKSGIPAIPYKGPVLAAAVYGDPGLRRAGDLDVLIPKERLLEAREILLSRGYVEKPGLTAEQERAYLYFERERPFVHYERRQVVELQWELMPRTFALPLPVAELGTRTYYLGDRPVTSLSPEDLLLVLCVHGTKHHWQRLQWVCDVARTLETFRGGLDREALLRRATELGCRRMLTLGLRLAHQMLEVEPPEGLGLAADAPLVEALAAEVRRGMALEIPERDRMLDETAFSPFHFRVRERLQDRLRYLARTALTPNYADWQDRPLPPALFFVYYLAKPFRLVRKYGWRRLCGLPILRDAPR